MPIVARLLGVRMTGWLRGVPLVLWAVGMLGLVAPGAGADELGGDGFGVPASDCELWGIQNLCTSPFDLSVNFGGSWYGYEVENKITHINAGFGGARASRGDTLEIEPGSFQGGLRAGGLLQYQVGGLVIEPTVAFWMNDPLGGDRTDEGPTLVDRTGPGIPPNRETVTDEIEIKHGWDVAVGTQITWLIPDDTPLVGGPLGGLPLVFFPFLGVSQSEWELEIREVLDTVGFGRSPIPPIRSNNDRDYDETSFMVGFDLDIPLPGSQGPFTHALTFGFKWIEGSEKHRFAQRIVAKSLTPAPGGPPSGTAPLPGFPRIEIDAEDTQGYRVELRYQVTWNDFGGFFRRTIFGPVD